MWRGLTASEKKPYEACSPFSQRNMGALRQEEYQKKLSEYQEAKEAYVDLVELARPNKKALKAGA